MHSALRWVDHRPWPVPPGRWIWRQSWCDLLFAHWRIDSQALRQLVPAALEIQQFDGSAWLGVVPFRMSGVMHRPLPDLPGISAFPELNVRTYVEFGGKPGVWFLSLDATNALAVWAARKFFYLPYHRACMSLQIRDDEISYQSERVDGRARFRGSYRPTAPVRESMAGTLEHWLTERYCLYAVDPRGRLVRTEVHHRPWPLQNAEAEIVENTFFDSHGLLLTGPPSHLCFARALDVVVWSSQVVH